MQCFLGWTLRRADSQLPQHRVTVSGRQAAQRLVSGPKPPVAIRDGDDGRQGGNGSACGSQEQNMVWPWPWILSVGFLPFTSQLLFISQTVKWQLRDSYPTITRQLRDNYLTVK